MSLLQRSQPLLCLALLVLVAAPRGAAVAPADARSPEEFELADLAWLAGHWKEERQEKFTEELWMPARGGMMLGLNRTSREKGKGQFEYLRIEQDAEGIVYFASPGGSMPTPFRLMVLEADRAIFENPEHDFPKVIEYRLEDGKLEVSIAGDEPGPAWSFERGGDVK